MEISTLRAFASVDVKFLSILNKKYIFPILHAHFYRIPTSICLYYYLFYLNNIFLTFYYYLSTLSF